MTNDINLKSMLKKYRNSLDKKYPDPEPKSLGLQDSLPDMKLGGK